MGLCAASLYRCPIKLSITPSVLTEKLRTLSDHDLISCKMQDGPCLSLSYVSGAPRVHGLLWLAVTAANGTDVRERNWAPTDRASIGGESVQTRSLLFW